MEKKDVQEIFDLYVEVLKKKLREANTPLMDLNDGIRTIDRLDRMLGQRPFGDISRDIE